MYNIIYIFETINCHCIIYIYIVVNKPVMSVVVNNDTSDFNYVTEKSAIENSVCNEICDDRPNNQQMLINDCKFKKYIFGYS